MKQQHHILIIDDEPNNLAALAKVIEREGWQAWPAESAMAGLELMQRHPIQLVITDLKMPDMDGLGLLRKLKSERPDVEIILVTAHGTIEKAVAAIKEGAYDFIAKPFERHTIIRQIQKALEKHSLWQENQLLRQELAALKGQTNLIGSSPLMAQVRAQIKQAAQSDATVLILGESGTGKELVALSLHQQSPRASKSYVKLSCTTIPDNLLEAELFGYEKGAFTGALKQREGRFEVAAGGTLFLDEIGDLPLSLQGKLLRVLQEGAFERLGSNKTQHVDVRIIAATHRDLPAAIAAQHFREDLYYRLNVIAITLPSLRQRREDIPLLAEHFMRQFAQKNAKVIHGIERDVMQRLEAFDWPGNVRQLENTIERAVVFAQHTTIGLADLPPLQDKPGTLSSSQAKQLNIPLGTPLEDIERQVIEATLAWTQGDKNKAAALLGIAARTIYRKVGSDTTS